MPESLDPQLDELRRRARRRLIGAVVLALAAAVLVPMLLESDPKPLGEDVSVRIPPVDDGKFVSKLGDKSPPPATAPAKPAGSPDTATSGAAKDTAKEAPKDAAATSTTIASPPATPSVAQAEQRVLAPPAKSATLDGANGGTSKPSPPAKTTEPAPAAPSSVPAAKSTDAAPADAKATGSVAPSAAEAPKSASKGSYSVQLAAFSDDKGANALAGRLKKAGHPAYTEPYTTSRGTLWRVRVGPYGSREAAESARAKLKADGQNGIIAAAN